MVNATNWQGTLESARTGLALVERAQEELSTLRDAATAEIAKYLRIDTSVELDIAAIQATLTRPYTLLPINEHEAWLIHWRGVKLPIFGWVVAQEPAFTKSRVTRSMDLLTPLPAWMKSELGWKPPEHAALIDSTHTSVRLSSGDEATFKRRYSGQLGAKQADGSFKIKSGDAWIKLVGALIRDGILPYAPQPVDPANWNEGAASPPIKLHDYQIPAVKAFREKGAVLVNFPPGSGKTFITLDILNHFVGRVLLMADTVILTEQWRDRIQKFAPQADVTISTYQGASKHIAHAWDLLVFDECQRLPANTFSKLAFIKSKYRLGLTGAAWREDDRQFLITALSGFPVAIRWAELIKAGVLRRPRIIVATVASENAKTAYVKNLLAKRRGRAIIFCDWLDQGQTLADALDVPFIHGASQHKLDQLQEAEVCVVSRIGDRGLDLPDLRLVIEVAGAGAAREQFAQRVGRLLHGTFEGEFYTVFTPEEAVKFRPRVFGVEAEMAGEVDIEFITVGNVDGERAKAPRSIHVGRTTHARKASAIASVPTRTNGDTNSPAHDPEVEAALALRGVQAKLTDAQKSVGARTAPYVPIVFRLCFRAKFSAKEIAAGKGIRDVATISRYNSACKAMVKAGLFEEDAEGRFAVNRGEIERIRVLSRAMR